MTVRSADLLVGVLDDIEPLMQAAFDAVGGVPQPGSVLDQVFLLDGREVVIDHLEHGELGEALHHLLYMITEPNLAIRPDTHRRLLEAARVLRYPAGGMLEDVTVR